MTQDFESIEIECECGNVHTLDFLSVERNSLVKLVSFLSSNLKRTVRILLSENVPQWFLKLIQTQLQQNNIFFITDVVRVRFAEEIRARTIEYKGEDFLIAVGDFKLIDVAKYYASCIGLELCVVVCGEFCDFTFSKYARLYDGISYAFFVTTAPLHVVVFDDLLECDISIMKKIFHLKSLAFFENTLSMRMDDKCVCSKINSKLLKAIKSCDRATKPAQMLEIGLFLGRAMSFFGGTKRFFGAEMDVCSILEVKTKKSFFECYMVSSELIFEVYKVALEGNLKILNLNLNKRLDKIKEILGLSAISCMSFLKKQKSIQKMQKETRIIKALKFMLMGLIEGNELNIACDIEKKTLLESLYVSPEFSPVYRFLNLLRDLGYLENLTTLF